MFRLYTILWFVHILLSHSAFALTPKTIDLADCANQLVQHLESVDGHYLPLKRAASVLTLRPRATLLMRASLSQMVGSYEQLQNLSLAAAGVQIPTDLQFIGGGFLYFAIAGVPGSLLDFLATLPKRFEFLQDPKAISFQVLDTDLLPTEALDFSLSEEPFYLSIRSQPPERAQRVHLDGMRDPLIIVPLARIQSLIESRELIALVDAVVRVSDQRMNDAVPQFSQKLKSLNPFILRARDLVLLNQAAWTALLRLRGELALSRPVANSELRSALATCLGTACSPDFVREPNLPAAEVPKAVAEPVTAKAASADVAEPMALKAQPTSLPSFTPQASISLPIERALEIITAEQDTLAQDQARYSQLLRDPQFALKSHLAELFRGQIRDQLAMDRQILELAADWANSPDDLATLIDLDHKSKHDLELSAHKLLQLMISEVQGSEAISLQIVGKRSSLGHPEADVVSLVNLYKTLAAQMNWSFEVLSFATAASPQTVVVIKGRDAFNLLKFESGTHRFVTHADSKRWTRYVEVKLSPAPSQTETTNREYVRDYGQHGVDVEELAQIKNTELSQLLLKARETEAWQRLENLAGVP